MSVLGDLCSRVLHGPDRHVSDERTGLKVVKIRDNLLVYRRGARKLWVDLEVKFIVSWNITTQAEVTAFNGLLGSLDIEDFYEFVRTGRSVMLNAGGDWYYASEYERKFGPAGRSHSTAGHGY